MPLKNLIVAFASMFVMLLPSIAQTVAEAQKQALEKYPDLARDGSAIHAQFLKLYNDAKASDPKLLSNPDWPLILADRANTLLNPPTATPSPEPTSTPVPALKPSEQAIPPQKPIVIRSEIGETATTSDKVHISVHAVVTPQELSCSVSIQDTQFMGGEFRIVPEEIKEFATLVQTASDKLLSGESFSGKTKNTIVTVTNEDGQKVLKITFERKGFNLSTSQISMDADNAATLARLVTRAKQTIDWLAPRLKYLQPTKP
jgi:hypothetical protein